MIYSQADIPALYEKHYRRVFGVCVKMVHDPELAEDIAQDVFIQVFRKIEKFKGECQITTWLHRIAVNQVLMYWRAQKKKALSNANMSLGNEIEEEDQIDPFFDTEAPAGISIDDRVDLKQAIDALPAGYRKVLVLHDLIGLEHEEVGRFLGISAGTSKSQLHKARNKARKLFTMRRNPRVQLMPEAA